MNGKNLRDQSLPELFSSLTEQLSSLVRAELALARAELSANARQAITGGGLLSAAAVVGFTAWLAIVAGAIAGIAEGLPVWASALIIGGALAAAAGVLALIGRARLAHGMKPLPMTTDTVRQDLHELTARSGTGTPGPAQQPVPAQRVAVPAQRPAPRELPLHQPAPRQEVPGQGARQ